MKAKTQHWVPQLYLRHFATPQTIKAKKGRQQIHVQSWVGAQEFYQTNIGNVASENYLYSPIDPATGERNWAVDDRLQEFESFIGKAWSAFVNHNLPIVGGANPDYGNVPHGDMLRQAITMFVMQLHQRNPYNKKTIEKVAKEQYEELDKLPKDSNGIPAISQMTLPSGEAIEVDLSDWHETQAVDEQFIEKIFLGMQESGSRESYNALYNKKWQILVAQDRYFITSDRPVVISNPAVGFLASNVYFPISPQKCLVMLSGEHEQGYFTDCDEHVPLFNSEITRSAEERTYSHLDQVKVMNEILQYHDKYLVEPSV